MHLRMPVFVALIALGSAAGAQTTNCHWAGQIWTCDTQHQTELDPNIILHANDAFARMPTYQERVAEQQKIELENLRVEQHNIDVRTAEAKKALGGRIGKMVSDGNCSGAQAAALEAGDFDLANQVKSYCAK